MSYNIEWDPPVTDQSLNTSTAYLISVYRCTTTEDGDYTLIDTINAYSGGAWVSSYTDGNGSYSYWYYVRYYEDPNGAEKERVIAYGEPTVRELRVKTEIRDILPAIIKASFTGAKDRQIYNAMGAGLRLVNVTPPLTSFTFSNMPRNFEPVVSVGTQMFLYLQFYLGLGIRDFSYSDSGLALSVDRGAKIAQAIEKINKLYKEMVNFVKMEQYPAPIGLGSYALATPFARILDIVYQIRE